MPIKKTSDRFTWPLKPSRHTLNKIQIIFLHKNSDESGYFVLQYWRLATLKAKSQILKFDNVSPEIKF